MRVKTSVGSGAGQRDVSHTDATLGALSAGDVLWLPLLQLSRNVASQASSPPPSCPATGQCTSVASSGPAVRVSVVRERPSYAYLVGI